MRYLPLTPDDRVQMLGDIGVDSIDALFVDVPAAAASAPASMRKPSSKINPSQSAGTAVTTSAAMWCSASAEHNSAATPRPSSVIANRLTRCNPASANPGASAATALTP